MEVNRLLFNKLWNEISEPEVSILLGTRQVGKSTLLKQLEKEAKNKGYTTQFYNLELASDLEKFSRSEKDIFKMLSSNAKIIFIDEFHYLKNAFKIFKALYDSHCHVKIFASGSSSVEIHKHLKESLAGRFRKTMVYPLSLPELRQIPRSGLADYCQWGGMPGLIHQKGSAEKIELLDNIVSTYLTKDIKALIQEENVRAFNSLLYLLAQNQGSVGIVANLAREIGLSESTLVRHLEIMSQTYVCHIIPSYAQNLANELKKSKKYYLFDLGIRNGLLKDFRPLSQREDQGIIHESFVLLHLITQLKPNMEIRFWRTKKGEEVDFILLKNRVPVPIEVKSNIQEKIIPKGMCLFLKNYPKIPFGIVFNTNLTGEVLFENQSVFFKKIEEAVELEHLKEVF